MTSELHSSALFARRLIRSISDLLWVASPKVVSGGLQLLMNLLLVGRLGPERSGVVFVCVTAILLADAILGSAMDVAVVRLATGNAGHNPERLLQVQKAALVAKAIACTLLAVPLLIWSRTISSLLFHDASHSPLIVLSVISLFGLLVLRSVQTCFQIAGHFKLYGIADLLHSGVRFGGLGAFFLIGLVTPPMILTLYAIAPVSVAAALFATSARRVIVAPFARAALVDVLQIVKWYLGAAALSAVNSRMDILLVSAVASTAAAGLFSAAQVCIMPFQLLGMYLAVVFAPRILPLWERGLLRPIYFRFQASVAAACVLAYLMVFLSVGQVTARVLPSSFDGAAGLILLLLPSSLTALVNFPWTVSFLMFTHPRFLFAMELCAFPVLLLLYRYFVGAHGAAGAAAVTTGYALVKTAVFQILAGRSLRRDPTRPRESNSLLLPDIGGIGVRLGSDPSLTPVVL